MVFHEDNIFPVFEPRSLKPWTRRAQGFMKELASLVRKLNRQDAKTRGYAKSVLRSLIHFNLL